MAATTLITMFSILKWFKNHHTMFIHCNREVSTIQLSRPLWEQVMRDKQIIDSLRTNIPLSTEQSAPAPEADDPVIDASQISGFAVLFSKIANPVTLRNEGHTSYKPRYVFFVNPVWHLHGISDPRKIQTVPISISQQGHIGFQTIQPTVEEIASVYGIDYRTKIFDIRVKRFSINGEPYYELQR